MSIADNIKQLRHKKHLTQKQLAERSGLAVITIQQYEAGKYNPKPNAIMKLCIGLDCKATDIIDDENSRKYYRMFDNVPKYIGQTIEGKVPQFTVPSTTLAPQEAYELLHSLIDKEGIDDIEREEVSQQLKRLLGSFKGLNEIGRAKAVERIEELYMIPKYIFENFPDNIE